jgi:hypothetical protein
MSRLRIIVTGLIAQHPALAGVAWDYLQYVLGLQRLGHDVFYLEDSGEWPYTMERAPGARDWVAEDCQQNVEHLAALMARFGLADRWAYRFPLRSSWFGMTDRRRREVIGSADLLINVSGTLEEPVKYRQVPRLVFIDSDPVFTQVRLCLTGDDAQLELFRNRAAAHDVHFSFGERRSAAVPDAGYRWRPTRQPIVLSEWAGGGRAGQAFTTVMSWTSYQPLRYRGQVYAQKDAELRRFLDLPGRVAPSRLEVSLGPTPHADWETSAGGPTVGNGNGRTPRELLRSHGWHVRAATGTCRDIDAYRRYIQSSKAEWSVAKNGYVVAQPGWFSCRSACYLAAGRPVVVQNTGFSSVLPVGEGLLAFNDLDGAIAGIEQVERDYGRHSRAARAIAAEYFDSDKVLTRLIDEGMASHV